MRLFVALEPNSKVVANLTELVRRLGPVAPIQWIHPRNVHLPLKYIGETPKKGVDAVIQALSSVQVTTPLNIPLAGLGFFPISGRPRVFWVGAENTSGLRQLATGVDAILQPLGVVPEVRPFQPHLTLGRVMEGHSLEEMKTLVEELPSREFGVISPDRFGLFGSTVTANGPEYSKLAEFPISVPVAATTPFTKSPAVGRL
jgi:2'-5' RNA ligase